MDVSDSELTATVMVPNLFKLTSPLFFSIVDQNVFEMTETN